MNIWYFAYGSDVKVAQMKERVGDFKLSKRAVARNFKLVFNAHSKKNWHGYTANIQHTGDFGDKVLGVVYHITDTQLAKLQTFEGTPQKIDISVELEDGSEIKNAKTFLWNSTEREHEPPEAYRRIIEEGLIEHGYDRSTARKIFVDKFGY
jgi:cation transport regulator ChaC